MREGRDGRDPTLKKMSALIHTQMAQITNAAGRSVRACVARPKNTSSPPRQRAMALHLPTPDEAKPGEEEVKTLKIKVKKTKNNLKYF